MTPYYGEHRRAGPPRALSDATRTASSISKEREKGKERRPHGHESWDSDGHSHPSPPGGGRQVRRLCVRVRGQRLRRGATPA